ncbi:MAG: HAMP domain-containing sensor histidine kinase [Chryseolinea sp.]
MRLLQVSLRTLLVYSLIMVLISIPMSIFAVRELLNDEVDESLALRSDQFLKHIKSFEYLDDLELDLKIWDQLSYDVSLIPTSKPVISKEYRSVPLFDSLEHDFHPFRTLTSPVDLKGNHYLLTIRMSLVDNEALIIALVLVQATLIILLAGGLLLLNRSLSRRLWKPFYNTLNQLKAYQLDKAESFIAEKTNIVEFDDLNKTVSHLTERNKRVFLEQKEFIENASHELQTPLAIFHSKLDNLMQIPSLTEAQATTILELEETAQRMSRLNKNLLLLSKIGNDQFREVEDIEVSDLVSRLVSNLKTFADADMTISTAIQPLTIKANGTLIEILLSNLFNNAVRHNVANGEVLIEVSQRTMSITNTGNRLVMDKKRMFERFSKESRHEKSTGLGLAIVKKICDTCSYNIAYSFSNGKHTFSVTFL